MRKIVEKSLVHVHIKSLSKLDDDPNSFCLAYYVFMATIYFRYMADGF